MTSPSAASALPVGQGCPHCGQGALYRITIVRVGVDSFICDECDTVWLKYEDVLEGSGVFVDHLLDWVGDTKRDYQSEFVYREVWQWPQPATVSYTSIIKNILRHYAAIKPSYGEVEAEIVENDATGHYELRWIGWNGPRRIHDCLLHVDIKGDKIWIQHDGLGEGITDDLLEAGVPAERIVLAWHTEKERRMMGTFAVN